VLQVTILRGKKRSVRFRTCPHLADVHSLNLVIRTGKSKKQISRRAQTTSL
jgi:hypothetical protein